MAINIFGALHLRVGRKVFEGGDLSWYMFGRLDDFRIYNYALSETDINRLVNLQEPLPRPDFDRSGRVNFNDYADLGDAWLEEKLFPYD